MTFRFINLLKKNNLLKNNLLSTNKLSTNNNCIIPINNNYTKYKKYNYNFIYGGICGFILTNIYDNKFNNEHNKINNYPSNFFINTLNNFTISKYTVGFVVGSLLYPISYSLLSACIFFEIIKIII
jgi:hypothetical protein